MEDKNILFIKDLLNKFLSGDSEGYISGCHDNFYGKIFSGLIPGGDKIEGKEQLRTLFTTMQNYMEIKKFAPRDWSSIENNVYFTVDWEFIWKPTNKLVKTSANVKKVIVDNKIKEKYHIVNYNDIVDTSTENSEEEIKQFITEFNESQTNVWMNFDEELFNKHWSKFNKDDKVMFIRPSGNPAGKETFNGMMKNSDISFEYGKLLSIETVNIFAGGYGATVTYKRHDKFSYKGIKNDDISLFTATLEKINGEWKIIFGTRSTGEKPSN